MIFLQQQELFKQWKVKISYIINTSISSLRLFWFLTINNILSIICNFVMLFIISSKKDRIVRCFEYPSPLEFINRIHINLISNSKIHHQLQIFMKLSNNKQQNIQRLKDYNIDFTQNIIAGTVTAQTLSNYRFDEVKIKQVGQDFQTLIPWKITHIFH